VVGSRDELQRQLIRLFDARVSTTSASLYVGMRWRDRDAVYATLKPSKLDLPPNYLFADYKATLSAFIGEYVVVDKKQDSSVVAEMPEDDGTPTFAGELTKFCEANSRLVPSHVAILYELNARGIMINKQRRRTIYGMSVDILQKNTLSSDRTVVEILTVCFHSLFMFLPGTVLLTVALYAQEVYSRTTVTRTPLLWQNFFALDEPGFSFWFLSFFSPDGPQIMGSVRMTVLELVTFGILTSVHMILHYVDGGVWFISNKIYGFVLFLHTLGLLLHLSLTLTWCLLAAVLDPNRFLPAGTAIVVAIVVVSTTRTQLTATANKLRKALSQGFELRLQTMLHRALEINTQQRLSRQQAEVKSLGLSANLNSIIRLDDGEEKAGEARVAAVAGAQGAEKAKAAEKLLPADVFNLIASKDGGSDTALDVEEFQELFEKLDLDISRARREQLFAYMDMSGDGFISQKEFEDGWTFLVDMLVEEAVDSAGVSPGQIAIAVAGLVLWLFFVFGFIFLAVQSWFTSGSFAAAIQSMFIGVTGFLTQRFRGKPRAENPEDFDGLVKGFVKDFAR